MIGENRITCSHQERPDEEVDTSLTFDYLYQSHQSGKTFYYQAAKYDGQNIGHFINQGGLQEGLKEMFPGFWNFRGSTSQVQRHAMPLQTCIQEMLENHHCLSSLAEYLLNILSWSALPAFHWLGVSVLTPVGSALPGISKFDSNRSGILEPPT